MNHCSQFNQEILFKQKKNLLNTYSEIHKYYCFMGHTSTYLLFKPQISQTVMKFKFLIEYKIYLGKWWIAMNLITIEPVNFR